MAKTSSQCSKTVGAAQGLLVLELCSFGILAPASYGASIATPARAADSRVIVAGGLASPDYSGASSQSTTAPTRPPTAPTKNAAGTFAIGYYSWPTRSTVTIPQNGLPYPSTGYVHLDGFSSTSIIFDTLPEAAAMAVNMYKAMYRYGWKLAFETTDQNLHVNAIQRSDQGGQAIFTQANIGLFLDHGDYGTAIDYTAGRQWLKRNLFPQRFGRRRRRLAAHGPIRFRWKPRMDGDTRLQLAL